MKIARITDNARKKEFKIEAGGMEYLFPYAKLRLGPTSDDPVAGVYVDPDLGDEGFTYRLTSGAEDTVHLDAVREVNMDPDYLQQLLLHRLTVEARRGLEESDLGKRQIARHLRTSPSQLYRLLDPENPGKSLGQMLALLHLVGREVDLVVYPTSERAASSGAFQVYKDKSGAFRFRFIDPEGGTMLFSEPYRTKRACLEAIERVRDYSAKDALFEREKTPGGRYQFRLLAEDRQVIARSPAYKTSARRDEALATIRRSASDVKVEIAG